MPHALPPLPYPYGALEPTVDELTMRIHHDKHHGGYLAGLNAALEGTGWADRPVEDLLRHLEALPEAKRALVRTNGGGHLNHSLFWQSMAPDDHGRPAGPLADAIESAFGSVRELKRQLTVAGTARVGSGWAWLVHDGAGLAVSSTADEESPLMYGQTPLLGVDVWEHAYYLRHQDRRADYIEAWWNVVDWQWVAARYAAATRGGDVS
ncbi:MAG TPA: superoxide dismutase [Solirubrobacteraceae bacterium]|nr:superoxide dismutase [Solirubrobacteraceae bacterium]